MIDTICRLFWKYVRSFESSISTLIYIIWFIVYFTSRIYLLILESTTWLLHETLLNNMKFTTEKGKKFTRL